MATQRVLYDDKETFQVSTLPEIQKATAANYNELKDVINFNAQAIDDIFSLTIGDVSAIQNAFTSDITAQTGTKTFTLFDSDITTAGRTSTGDVDFVNYKKDAVSKYKITVDGIVVTGGANSIQANDGTDTISWDASDNVSIPNGQLLHDFGSAAAPGISWVGNTNLGFFRAGSVMIATIGGTAKFRLEASGINPNTTDDVDLGTTLLFWKTIFANSLILENLNQEIKTAHVQLTQSEIQDLFSTVIDVVPAQGAGTYIQMLQASAFLNHNGTTYAVASQLILGQTGGTTLKSTSSLFIDSSSDRTEVFFEHSVSNQDLIANAAIEVQGDANATGAGGTIDIYVQYVVIDTN